MRQAATGWVAGRLAPSKGRKVYLAALLLPLLALALPQAASPRAAVAEEPAAHYEATLKLRYDPDAYPYWVPRGCAAYLREMSCAVYLVDADDDPHYQFTYGGVEYTILSVLLTEGFSVKLRVTPLLTAEALSNLVLQINQAVYPLHSDYRVSVQQLRKNLDIPPGRPGRNEYLLNAEESVVTWDTRWTWDLDGGFRSYRVLSGSRGTPFAIKLTDWPQPTKRVNDLRLSRNVARNTKSWSHVLGFDLQAPLSAGASFVVELPAGYGFANPDRLASKIRMTAIAGPTFHIHHLIEFSQVAVCTTADTPSNCGAKPGTPALKLTVRDSRPGSMVPRTTRRIWLGFRSDLGVTSPATGGLRTWRVNYDGGPWSSLNVNLPKQPTTIDPDHPYAALIAQIWQWRNDPCCVSNPAHTERWDRTLQTLGVTVNDQTLEPMTASEAQTYADRGWNRWVGVVTALQELEAALQQPNIQPTQTATVNQAPLVSAAPADVVIVNASGTRTVSLAGAFRDPDGDALTVSAVSSNEAVATVTVASGGSNLSLQARSPGAATITLAADDGKGGTVSDAFTVTVKAAPLLASALPDVTGLQAGATREVSLSSTFRDPDGDALTLTVSSSNQAVARVTVASGGSGLTVTGVAEGTATISVVARDPDGNQVSDEFAVSVEPEPRPASTLSGIVADYDANGDGEIDLSEYRQAVRDYTDRKISYAEMFRVLMAYRNS